MSISTKTWFVSRIILLAVLFLFLSACDSGGSDRSIYTDTLEMQPGPLSVEDNVSAGFDRKIIKEGNIRFETSSVKETQSFIKQTLQALGGYIGDENVFDYKYRIEHNITVRVPENKFDLLVEKISEIAEKIDSKNINSKDVTEEFIDVEARVKTKKELEARYKEILKQANRVDEILNIEREIGKLRSEIESLEGRLNYLKNRMALSSLTITYYEKVSSPFGFFSKFFQALKNGWNYLLWFIIILTSLWPFILFVVLVLVVVTAVNKKKKKKQIIG
ncbi:MAG TPA: DUF4349 domain-containing protein [Ignavibacteriaceae bacterium]|nr:DUF4349 domain-containing protein [Ignavibacteriaceae bacterium]